MGGGRHHHAQQRRGGGRVSFLAGFVTGMLFTVFVLVMLVAVMSRSGDDDPESAGGTD